MLPQLLCHFRVGSTLLVALLVLGCSNAPDPAATPTGPTATRTAASGQSGAASDEAGLRLALLRLGDVTLTEMNRLGRLATPAETTPEARAFVGAVRADVGTTATTLVVEPDAESAFEALRVSASAKRLAAESADPGVVGASVRDSVSGALVRATCGPWANRSTLRYRT